MARHISEPQETQAKTVVSKASPRSTLGRRLSASLLRAIGGGDSWDGGLLPSPTPQPPPDTRG